MRRKAECCLYDYVSKSWWGYIDKMTMNESKTEVTIHFLHNECNFIFRGFGSSGNGSAQWFWDEFSKEWNLESARRVAGDRLDVRKIDTKELEEMLRTKVAE